MAEGAVSYYLNHWVKSRVSKYTFGVPCSVRFREEEEEHTRREHTTFLSPSGLRYLPGAFETILQRVSPFREYTTPVGLTMD